MKYHGHELLIAQTGLKPLPPRAAGENPGEAMVPETEYCCEEMKEEIITEIFFIGVDPEDGRLRVGHSRKALWLPFKYCPFCGMDVEYKDMCSHEHQYESCSHGEDGKPSVPSCQKTYMRFHHSCCKRCGAEEL